MQKGISTCISRVYAEEMCNCHHSKWGLHKILDSDRVNKNIENNI